MASPPRTREREEERRLNVRTLAIASAASASAAVLTSRLWIAGTWIAAAVTPVIVAIVSELLHRPSERIARVITADRPALRLDETQEPPAPTTHPDPDAPGTEAPVRVYRQPVRPARRRFAFGVVAATAAIALAIAAVVVTVPELIAGQSIGGSDSATSLWGGKSRKKRSEQNDTSTPTTTVTAPTTTVTVPEDTTTTPTETATTPTTTAPPARTAPAAPRTAP
jgi:hypothetical protein